MRSSVRRSPFEPSPRAGLCWETHPRESWFQGSSKKQPPQCHSTPIFHGDILGWGRLNGLGGLTILKTVCLRSAGSGVKSPFSSCESDLCGVRLMPSEPQFLFL